MLSNKKLFLSYAKHTYTIDATDFINWNSVFSLVCLLRINLSGNSMFSLFSSK
uniref:Uncharacterized protein n=1 Tax=Schistosoma curassoni TaxID=6186 RepID=A0A183L243_9TREM